MRSRRPEPHYLKHHIALVETLSPQPLFYHAIGVILCINYSKRGTRNVQTPSHIKLSSPGARCRWPGLDSLLFLLLWAAAEAGRRVWAELKRRADAGQPLGASPKESDGVECGGNITPLWAIATLRPCSSKIFKTERSPTRTGTPVCAWVLGVYPCTSLKTLRTVS